tara:strand:+ start:183 stop:1247 length:1065 start_codon:yes stop_codon:yes gene_type:complete
MLSIKNKVILYLYAEVMGYTISTIEELCKLGYEVHILHWDKKKLSSYEISTNYKMFFYKRSEYNYKKIKDLVSSLKPSITVVSGWMDFEYLKIANYLRKNNNKVVCGLDTQWRGTLKQKFAALIMSKFFLKRFFSNAWVPGFYQFEYAKNLGFKNHEIIYNLYCGDVKKFFVSNKKKDFSSIKTLLFVGRLEKVKGLNLLLKAWVSIKNKRNWKLKIIGNGSLIELIPKDDLSIEHIKFLEPEKLSSEMNASHAFILPSTFEPFALVVHEASLCGLPIITTNRNGSTNFFLINNFNGFLINIDKNPLKSITLALCKLINLNENDLEQFSARSRELSKVITPERSANSLISIIND